MNKNRWKRCGVFYFAFVFTLVPALASAYIDPSVTTYAIQAIAGVAVAAGAFFATYGRRMKKSWMKTVGVDGNEAAAEEAPLEVTREDLRADLAAKRESRQAAPAAKKHKSIKGRIITSLLCGFSPAMILILRPAVSFYLSNESEFWFRLEDLLPDILLVFAVLGLGAGLIHFLLPDGRKFSLRLWFAAAAAAGTLCAFIQDHFMSFYLPALTGEIIDWDLYSGWNTASLLLWGGIFLLFIVLLILRPRFMKITVYAMLALLLCADTAAGAIDVATANHDNSRIGTYFSRTGMYETAEAGNVVVLVSDTYEATYLNEILEKKPECEEYLQDVTYYDNTSGISVFTHLSFPKILTGVDFPLGKAFEEGVTWTFAHQTLVDRILDNGWDVNYYTEFSPSRDMKGKILTYADDEQHPNREVRIRLVKNLLRGCLFRSVPQPLKKQFMVTNHDFDAVRFDDDEVAPYWINDKKVYERLRDEGLKTAEGKPRYTVVELSGLHEPCTLDENFETIENYEQYTLDERHFRTGQGQLKLLRLYLDRLKEAGTYDSTTVIMIADHGRENRFHPILLVKEAGRKETGFVRDHTPVSLQMDFPDLVLAVTGGESFSAAAARLADPDRVRYGLDYRAPRFMERVFSRFTVNIPGYAGDPGSFTTDRDEFILDDDFAGRYTPGMAILSGGKVRGNTAAVYGVEDGAIPGHSVVFDLFFSGEESRKLTLEATVRNITGDPQRILFSLNGEPFGEPVTLAPESGPTDIRIPLPETVGSRMTLEMDFPDAFKTASVGWSTFESILIPEARIIQEE